MAKYSPQTNYFKTSKKLTQIYNYTFWIIFLLSMVLSIFKQAFWVSCLSIFSIILLSILELVSDNFKIKAEKIRRMDFIDNSFGTKLVHDSSDDYYDNDELEPGINKAILNLFENSFFSMRVSEEMMRKHFGKNIIFTVIIIGFAIYGFSNSVISLPILQLYLSRYFILNMIKLKSFHDSVEANFNDLKSITEKLGDNRKLTDVELMLIRALVEYEVNIAESNLLLDYKIFNEMNLELTKEWQEIKVKYMKKGGWK